MRLLCVLVATRVAVGMASESLRGGLRVRGPDLVLNMVLCFFKRWRVGGEVLVSDRKQKSWGVTQGALVLKEIKSQGV